MWALRPQEVWLRDSLFDKTEIVGEKTEICGKKTSVHFKLTKYSFEMQN